MDEPVQARHTSTLNSAYVDGHAKNVKAKPWVINGVHIGGYQPDGKAIKYYLVTDAGPYQAMPELRGIPYKRTDGTWGLQEGYRGGPQP